jgi:hypothetical protein
MALVGEEAIGGLGIRPISQAIGIPRSGRLRNLLRNRKSANSHASISQYLNVRVGHNNLDALRLDYFRDLTVMFQAFKADDLDWHVETIAVRWVTELCLSRSA